MNKELRRRLSVIDDWVSAWHKSPATVPLRTWLGWSWDEYAAYVEKGLLPAIERVPRGRANARKKKPSHGAPATVTEIGIRPRISRGLEYRCPECECELVERQNKKTGTWFYGCDGFPDCSFTADISTCFSEDGYPVSFYAEDEEFRWDIET